MRVLLVFNPIAGRGRARQEAERLGARLAADSIGVERVESAHPDAEQESDPEAPDAIVVLGGDGTVHAAAPLAQRLGAPLYQFPLGTENLFAREFGMNRRYETLRRALHARRIEHVDVARCNDRTFLLMASVGPDANIIHRLASVRDGSITHLSYLPHIAGEVLRPTLTPISVRVDGRALLEERPGLVVVANSRQYAVRLDPARRASMRDGMLDVVFLPVTGSISLLTWMALTRLRLHDRHAGCLRARGREVVIHGAAPLLFQLDGEAGPVAHGDGAHHTLSLSVEPASLPVLCA